VERGTSAALGRYEMMNDSEASVLSDELAVFEKSVLAARR
jgi:hypothetical protein